MTNWDLNLNLLGEVSHPYRVEILYWLQEFWFKSLWKSPNFWNLHHFGQISKWLWTTGAVRFSHFQLLGMILPIAIYQVELSNEVLGFFRQPTEWYEKKSYENLILFMYITIQLGTPFTNLELHSTFWRVIGKFFVLLICIGWLCLIFVGIYIFYGLLKPDPGFRIGYAA